MMLESVCLKAAVLRSKCVCVSVCVCVCVCVHMHACTVCVCVCVCVCASLQRELVSYLNGSYHKPPPQIHPMNSFNAMHL